MRFLSLVTLAVLTYLPLVACGERAKPAESVDSFVSMTRVVGGLTAEVRVRAPVAAAHLKDVTAALDEIERLLKLTEPTGKDSELGRLNAQAGAGRVGVGRDLWDVLSLALDFARRSRGAYDPAVGAAARAAAIELHPPERAVALLEKGMHVDLGAVAHGFAAQAGWAVLGSRGVKRFLVQVGEVVVVAGAPSESVAGWSLQAGGDVEVLLADKAFARHGTSPAATVIAGDAPTAAALAQALTRMSWKDALVLANTAKGAEARVVTGAGPAETLGFRAFVRGSDED